MSGFFGIVRQDGKPVSQHLLDAVAEKMSFRGPDGNNVWRHDNFGSCFAFMRTGPAKQAPQQPVTWCNRLWLWGDVRLDARAELCAQLAENEKIDVANVTDEELLLRAWAKWGAGSLERVIGDFSFALWDAKEQVLWCARDFIGARPFFYAHVRGVLCFTNTLQVLRTVPEISGDLDECFVGDFLLAGWNLDLAGTVYQDIKRLPGGHLLKLAGNEIAVRRFCKLPIEEPLQLRRPEEYIELYRSLLDTTVSDRLPSAATALHLSGGLDSGAVCAVASRIAAAREQKKQLKAFTESFSPFFEDLEPPLAKVTAKHLGIAHAILEERTLQIFEHGGRPSELPPEPNDESFYSRQRRNSQRIAAYSNVVLSGEGGDEVLGGASWPYLVHLLEARKWIDILRDFGAYLWIHKSIPPLRAGIRTNISRFIKREHPLARYPRWLNEDFSRRVNLEQRWLALNAFPQTNEHPLHPGAYELLHSGVCARALETEDAGWNRVNLESRAPLLDLRMLIFLLRLPPVPWCMNKELCRQAMKGVLPSAIVSRKKTPLAGEPLEACGTPWEWLEFLPRTAPGGVEVFVNWQKWCETLTFPKGSLNLTILRPASLFFWLKAVEST